MTLVLDNGAYSLKVGLASSAEPRIIPNCITRSDCVRVTATAQAHSSDHECILPSLSLHVYFVQLCAVLVCSTVQLRVGMPQRLPMNFELRTAVLKVS